MSLSLNFLDDNDNNFVWHKRLSDDGVNFDPVGNVIAENHSGRNIFIVDVSGGDYRDFLQDDDLFVREGDNFIRKDLGFSGASKSYDLDGDGMDDIVFYSLKRLGWLRNEGGGDFSSSITVATLDGKYIPSGFVLKDIDGDGDVDIVTNGYKKEINNFFPGFLGNPALNPNVLPSVDYEASLLILYENLGDGSFRERRPFKALKGRGMFTFDPHEFIIEDIDNDGLQDVVIGANIYHVSLGGSNYLYRQKGDLLSFDDPVNISGNPEIGKSIMPIDINRDGHVDLLYYDYNGLYNGIIINSDLRLYINDGDGVSFSKSHSFGSSQTFVIEDLDGDGFQDLIYPRITRNRGENISIDDIGRVYWNRGSLVYAPVVKSGEPVSNSSFSFSWDSGKYAESYLVYVARDLSFKDKVSSYNGKKISGNINELLVDGDISSGKTYYYRMRSVGLLGIQSPYSNYDSVYLPNSIADIPDALLVLDSGVNSFVARWDESNNSSGYLIDVSSDIEFENILSSYNSYSLEDGDDELMKNGSVYSFNVSGLLSNTRYYYRVRGYNNEHTSGYSDTVSVVTLPIPPLALEADDVNDDGFVAKWEPVSGIESYRIEIGDDFSFSNASIYSAVDNSYSSIALTPGSSYYYRVRSVGIDEGLSDPSNVILVVTAGSNTNGIPIALPATL